MFGTDITAAGKRRFPNWRHRHVSAGDKARFGPGPVSVGIAVALCASPGAAAATADPADLCVEAAHHAAGRTGVPVDVLLAISLTETGRQGKPWPWTVNMQGAGRWFTTRQEAFAFAEAGRNSGARNFDIGCFQINYRWHGENFASIDAMFDPRQNALYAAEFLQALHRETGTWSAAAGAFHSRTEVHATRYRMAFEANLATVAGQPRPDPAASIRQDAPVIVARANAFPLLRQTETAGALGSLVPLGSGG